MFWVFYHVGLKDPGSPWYLFYSGSGGIIERLVELFAIGSILLRKHNCHAPHCPWIGRYPAVEGGGWQYCRRHHRHNGEHRTEGNGGV